MRSKIFIFLILSILMSLSCSGPVVKQENNFAIKMMEKGVLGEAEFRFRLQISQDAENWVAHNNLGVVLEQKGELDEALYHYETALSIIGENKGVEFNYSRLLEDLRDE